MSSKMSRKDKMKETTPSPTVMNPFLFMTPAMMTQWQTQMATMASTSLPSSSSTKTAAMSKAPWETSSSSSSSDEDFQPSQKQRKVSTGMASKAKAQTQIKRKPGRPKKVETQLKEAQSAADKQILDKYLKLSATGHDVFPVNAKDECKSCRLWTGVFAVQPCGHSKYCYSCISKLKEEALKLTRPGKCPSDNCFTLVTSWVKLFNISP